MQPLESPKAPKYSRAAGNLEEELPARKSTRLRALLESDELEFLMEAHNGISARIVEECGFRGIWASGLALSAQFGVRDNNEASWTQIVDMLEFMSDATSIPILLDGDTGYGNFNNMRRLVRKLEQRDIGGVCIEDKLFPKTNSFIDGERQPLADVDEFCGKIEAGRDSRIDPDFCIVARVEALIAGWGLDKALRRAHAYREAGADAILIHSKQRDPDEVLAFARRWRDRSPLVIVPTRYYSTPAETYREAGISVAIWANHLLRAAITAMQRAAGEIHRAESVADIEDQIAPVDEVFRLQGAQELAGAEKRYFASRGAERSAIVLAASRGNDLDPLTAELPKAMIPIAGSPLLQRLVDTFKRRQVNEITVVAGYYAETIESIGGIEVVRNPDYEHNGELASLNCALESITEDTVITYGDLLFRSYILDDLLSREDEVVAVVDTRLPEINSPDYRDLVWCTRGPSHQLFHED
ncbi:MAG: phosphoenolpyruvate mutase, partial [Gammaproteobacteria bacterium]|nr:phosphoenolpyruvate mutase [Gammaproteobacteria bacterium]